MIKTNYNQFKKELDNEIKKQQEKQKDTFRELVLTTYNSVLIASPVDKGTFRANNYIQSFTPNTQTDDKQTNISTLKNEAKTTVNTTNIKDGTSIFITNNLPYADKLENGYSKQAPMGIYGVAEEKTQQLINRLKREVIK